MSDFASALLTFWAAGILGAAGIGVIVRAAVALIW